MFIDNKYTRIYHRIIARGTSRMFAGGTPTADTYYERHHIIPRCMGGSNSNDNLALLTAREHFLCHWLLIFMTSGRYQMKLRFAFFRMCSMSEGQQRNITARQFEIANKHNRQASRERNKTSHVGLKRSEDSKKKMSNAKIGKVPMYHSDTKKIKWFKIDSISEAEDYGFVRGNGIDNKGPNNPMFGKSHSVSTRDKIGTSKKGKKWNGSLEELEKRRSKWLTDNPMADPTLVTKAALNRSKTYIITHLDGTEETVTNMAAYCRDNNLSKSNMSSVAKGSLKRYKGMVVRYA